MDEIRQYVTANPILYLSLLETSQGFSILIHMGRNRRRQQQQQQQRCWEEDDKDEEWETMTGAFVQTPSSSSPPPERWSQNVATTKTTVAALHTLRHCLRQTVRYHPRKHQIIASFQTAVAVPSILQTLWMPWLRQWTVSLLVAEELEAVVNRHDDDDDDHDNKTTPLVVVVVEGLDHLLTLLWFAVKQCESNKKTLMNARISKDGIMSENDTILLPSPMETTAQLLVTLVDRILALSRRGTTKNNNNNNNNRQEQQQDQRLVEAQNLLSMSICRLVTSLCTFEPELKQTILLESSSTGVVRSQNNDSNDNNDEKPNQHSMVISSAHETVMAFFQVGFVSKLGELISICLEEWSLSCSSSSSCDTKVPLRNKDKPNHINKFNKDAATCTNKNPNDEEEKEQEDSSSTSAAAALSMAIRALRSMAIHNDIVQAMVTVGLLHQVRQVFLMLAHDATSAITTRTTPSVAAVALAGSDNEDNEPLFVGTIENSDQDDGDNENENNRDKLDASPSLLYMNLSEHKKITTTTTTFISTLVSIMGLFRNVCANDEIKTSLCLGSSSSSSVDLGNGTSSSSSSSPSIVGPLVHVMTRFRHQALLQEHGCGTIAAMALRKPVNAHVLVRDYEAHLTILEAMRCHPQKATVQRQGALALRNLVSRSWSSTTSSTTNNKNNNNHDQGSNGNDNRNNNGPDLKQTVKEAGAEQVLLQISAQHASCQDEVYAALRDLGVQGVEMVNVQRDEDTGQVTVKRTEMFGETGQQQRQEQGARLNSNFRPVYD